MGRSNGFRREQRPLRIEPEVGQITEDLTECSPVIDGKKSAHVLEHHVPRSHVAKDAHDFGPEPPLVFHAAAGSCG